MLAYPYVQMLFKNEVSELHTEVVESAGVWGHLNGAIVDVAAHLGVEIGQEGIDMGGLPFHHALHPAVPEPQRFRKRAQWLPGL